MKAWASWLLCLVVLSGCGGEGDGDGSGGAANDHGEGQGRFAQTGEGERTAITSSEGSAAPDSRATASCEDD
ncbi:MAG: hypothetical protein PVI30_18700, partial [Myxococcales bacterium]